MYSKNEKVSMILDKKKKIDAVSSRLGRGCDVSCVCIKTLVGPNYPVT